MAAQVPAAPAAEAPQVVEVLVFRVAPQHQPRFLHVDDSLWTRALASHPGYLRKAVWRNPERPDELHLLVFWQSRMHWQRFPPALQQRTDALFQAALRGIPYTLLDVHGYDILADTP